MNNVLELEQKLSQQSKIINRSAEVFSGFNNTLSKFNIKIPPPVSIASDVLQYSGKKAMAFEEGMTKVKMTAGLDEASLANLKTQLKKVVRENKADIDIAPAGLERIISQVGDTDKAMKILDASLKGSKAGFTSLDTVSDALVGSLSVLGNGEASAKEVLDVFFAAQRVGTGNFESVARFMPNIISGASSMGLNYKEAAGAFAFMTSKGQSVEQAAGLMESAFTALGNTDIQQKMQGLGIHVKDQEGQVRSMMDIFGELSGVMNGMNSEQKTSLLESLGLTDESAFTAFSLMTSDMDSLQTAVNATGNAAGETNKALDDSTNTALKATEMWANLGYIGNGLGEFILPLICIGLDAVNSVLGVACTVTDSISNLFSGWFTQLQDGDPLIWGLTGALAALSAGLLLNWIRTNATLIAIGAMYVWDGISAIAKWGLTAAQWALNAAMNASPIGWIILGVSALVGVLTYCWQRFEGFRGTVYACWEVIKGFGNMLKEYVIDRIKGLLSGISGVGEALLKLFQGDFSGAWDSAKKGASDMLGIEAAKKAAGNLRQVGQDAALAYNKGIADFRASKEKKDTAPGSKPVPDPQTSLEKFKPALEPAYTPPTLPKLSKSFMPKMEMPQAAPANSQGNAIDLNEPVTNLKQSSDYTAVIDQLSPSFTKPGGQTGENKAMDGFRKIAAVATIPLAMSVGAPSFPDAGASEATGIAGITAGQEDPFSQNAPGNESRTIQIDRVCDSIIINVANTGVEGTEEIKDNIIKVLDEITMYYL